MRTVIQRVQHCSVTIDGQLKSNIGNGMLVLVGIEDRDTQEDIEWLCPSFSNSIFISAPNSPVATFLPICSPISAQNDSYIGMAKSGLEAWM